MNSTVEQHYFRKQLFETIVEALQSTGVDIQHCTPEDLAPVDEFHVRGHEVTKELAAAAQLKKGMHILDVGCGIGGPCRLFAGEYGCIATGIDITQEYIRTAKALSELTGLQNNTRFIQADALDMPFEDNSFDVVWTQHVQMNIAGKKKFYREIYRVLKPGGRFFYYDIFSKAHQPIYFPVPWAGEPHLSFLITTQELQALLKETGFQQQATSGQTAKGILFFQNMFNKIQQEGRPKFGLHILIGEAAPERLKNLLRNLMEEKVVLESGSCLKQ